MPRCLIVSGLPCAGKSTLARAIAARFEWPLLAKDAYKESLFDRLGVADRRWSASVSRLAWSLLLADAGAHLARGRSCVLEGNFRAAQRAALEALATIEHGVFVEARVTARADVLSARYRARALDGTRHAGHVDLEALAEIEREFARPPAATFGAGRVIEVDTSAGIDCEGIIARLETALART